MKRLARALEDAARTRSRLRKVEVLAAALASVAADSSDEDLAVATRFLGGRTLAVRDARTVGVGGALLFETMMAATGHAADIAAMCVRATGDVGEAFGLLVRRIEGAETRPGLTLAEAAHLFDALAATGARLAKRRMLDAAFARATPLETKYLGKALLGEHRVGVQDGVLEEAMARAFAVPLEDLRRATALVTDLGEAAVLARAARLGEATLEVGRPVAFMLASPLETIRAPIDPSTAVVEDKIDGVRAQLHKDETGRVVIFARGRDDVTVAYPELEDAFRFVPGRFVLDGEILVVGEGGRPRPFQVLQARLRKTAPSRELLAAAKVALFAYDMLDDGTSLLALPWDARRARLEAFARHRSPGPALILNGYRALDTVRPLQAQLDVEFEDARARGHEGLVVKSRTAPYEAGRRGQGWIKVKRAFATLDVVVTAAETGTGRRAGVLSDYTFAVWSEGELVNVGKAYSGVTDREIDALTRRFEKLTVDRYGGVRAVRPEVVFEVGFDGVQRSKRHRSGFALRFPRILRIRDDKTAEQADSLATVAALYAAQLETGHREDAPDAVDKPARAQTARAEPAEKQLSLFGDEE